MEKRSEKTQGKGGLLMCWCASVLVEWKVVEWLSIWLLSIRSLSIRSLSEAEMSRNAENKKKPSHLRQLFILFLSRYV